MRSGICPIAVETLAGNSADPMTVEARIEKLRDRFGLADVVLLGDRGMLTSARIERFREVGGIGWVSCLRAPAIRALVEAGDLQLGLFDERNLAEITAPEFPGERLVAGRNPALADERARKREALLAATEEALAKVAGMVARGRLRTAAAIGLHVGGVVSAKQMAKHFELDIADGVFAYRRRVDQKLSAGSRRPSEARGSDGCSARILAHQGEDYRHPDEAGLDDR